MNAGISVVTVTYNCAQILEKTIQSVIGQTYKNLEFIIVDGDSSDGTYDIISKYKNKIHKIIREKDTGIYDAMNKGIKEATREWIYFLNAGDCFTSAEALEIIPFDKYYSDSSYCAIVTKVNVLTDAGIFLFDDIIPSIPFFESTKKFSNMGFSHQGVFLKTDLAKRNQFDLSYRLCSDYNMMRRLYDDGYRFALIDNVVALTEGRGGTSLSDRGLQMREEARVCGCERTFCFLFKYSWWYVKNVVKKVLLKINITI